MGRLPDPWQIPDWALAGKDGTFGGRFDDPAGEYRVLYASSQRLGCFLETLARFRPDLSLVAELAEIVGDDDFVPAGIVPREWLNDRLIGSALIPGTYADIGSSDWIAFLRHTLARDVLAGGFSDFDAAVLQTSAPRSLTQAASRIANRQGLDGLRYLSRYGHDLENWAVFEPFRIDAWGASRISAEDADLQTALRIHALHLSQEAACAAMSRS